MGGYATFKQVWGCTSIRPLGVQELFQSNFSVPYERGFTVASPFERLYPTTVEEIMRKRSAGCLSEPEQICPERNVIGNPWRTCFKR